MDKIQIESKPFAIDYWHSGTYQRADDQLFTFTIYDNSTQAIEITWCDEAPLDGENLVEIEKNIIEKYQSI